MINTDEMMLSPLKSSRMFLFELNDSKELCRIDETKSTEFSGSFIQKVKNMKQSLNLLQKCLKCVEVVEQLMKEN